MESKVNCMDDIGNYDLVVEIADSDGGLIKLNKIRHTNDFITEIDNMELKKVGYIFWALLECNEREIKINCKNEDIYVKVAYKVGNELEVSMNTSGDEVSITWINKHIEIKFKPIDENGIVYSKAHSEKSQISF